MKKNFQIPKDPEAKTGTGTTGTQPAGPGADGIESLTADASQLSEARIKELEEAIYKRMAELDMTLPEYIAFSHQQTKEAFEEYFEKLKTLDAMRCLFYCEENVRLATIKNPEIFISFRNGIAQLGDSIQDEQFKEAAKAYFARDYNEYIKSVLA